MTRPPDDPVPMSDPGELTLVGGRSLPPALVVGPAGILWLTADGETLTPGRHELAGLARRAPPLVCHRPSLCRRLGIEPFPALDLLELWAFVRPARPVVPTLGGLATALGRPRPADLEAQALLLFEATDQLLRTPDVQVVVDGYNVSMEGWPHLDARTQRDRLVGLLSGVAARAGARIQVVFDGDDDGRRPAVGAALAVRVHYTPVGVEADDVVIEMVGRLPSELPVVVVSSDRRVRDGARASGANVVSSAALLEWDRR